MEQSAENSIVRLLWQVVWRHELKQILHETITYCHQMERLGRRYAMQLTCLDVCYKLDANQIYIYIYKTHFCIWNSFLVKYIMSTDFQLKDFTLSFLKYKSYSKSKVVTPTTNNSPFSFIFFFFLQQLGRPSLAIKPLYDFRALVKMPAWLGPIWIRTGGCLLLWVQR